MKRLNRNGHATIILDASAFTDEIRGNIPEDKEAVGEFPIDVGCSLLRAGNNTVFRQNSHAAVMAAKSVGINIYGYLRPESPSLNDVLNLFDSVNDDERVNGLLVLLPVPQRINARKVVNAITTDKDIDGLGLLAIGRHAADESTFQIFKDRVSERFYEARFTSQTLSCGFAAVKIVTSPTLSVRRKLSAWLQ
ncbi:MAG: tetrahydrofolate dehydrogenase/cyclohydrolase catalytic domain-containing protein [Dissulfurispiraceae bacterium]